MMGWVIHLKILVGGKQWKIKRGELGIFCKSSRETAGRNTAKIPRKAPDEEICGWGNKSSDQKLPIREKGKGASPDSRKRWGRRQGEEVKSLEMGEKKKKNQEKNNHTEDKDMIMGEKGGKENEKGGKEAELKSPSSNGKDLNFLVIGIFDRVKGRVGNKIAYIIKSLRWKSGEVRWGLRARERSKFVRAEKSTQKGVQNERAEGRLIKNQVGT